MSDPAAMDALTQLGARVVWMEDFDDEGEVVLVTEYKILLVDTRIPVEEALRQALDLMARLAEGGDWA